MEELGWGVNATIGRPTMTYSPSYLKQLKPTIPSVSYWTTFNLQELLNKQSLVTLKLQEAELKRSPAFPKTIKLPGRILLSSRAPNIGLTWTSYVAMPHSGSRPEAPSGWYRQSWSRLDTPSWVIDGRWPDLHERQTQQLTASLRIPITGYGVTRDLYIGPYCKINRFNGTFFSKIPGFLICSWLTRNVFEFCFDWLGMNVWLLVQCSSQNIWTGNEEKWKRPLCRSYHWLISILTG